MSRYLYRLAKWCYGHRWQVLSAWVLAAVVAIALGTLSNGKESNNITIPGTESQNVANLLKAKLPAFSGAQTQVVFVSKGAVSAAASRAAIETTVQRMDHVSQVAQATDPFKARLVSADGHAALIMVQWRVSANSVSDSSLSALQTATHPASQADLRVAFGGQVYPGWNPKTSTTPDAIGIIIALIILLITFGAFAAAGMPILDGLIGVIIVVTGTTALAAVTQIASIAVTVAIMLGLSTGIDYGLFIVSRHRSQVLAGQPVEESVATAVGTAGSSVVFAGATVIVALVGLSAVGIPILRVMGLIAAGAVAISVLIALTLLPAMLSFAGPRVAHFIGSSRRPGRAERAARRAASHPERTVGARWASFVVRHRLPVLIVGLAVLLALAFPVTRMHLGLPSGASQPTSNTARQAYDLTDQHFGTGYNGALLAVATPVTSKKEAALITSRLAGVADVRSATPAAFQNGTAVIQVIPGTGPTASATTSLVNRIRAERTRFVAGTGARLLVGGPTASDIDVSHQLSSALPVFLTIVIGLAFILLTFAFRTILVPIKSILGFLFSVAAALGVEVAVFQWGWGASLLGVTKSAVTITFLPTVLLAIIFGLSSDYEVFVVSRIKEDFTQNGDARAAVQRGLGFQLRVVTAAALAMSFVFLAFMTSKNVEARPLAFAFAIGVLIDAFVVRLTLVPAVMSMVGAKLWYHPRWFAKYVPDPDIEGARLAGRHPEEQAASAARIGRPARSLTDGLAEEEE